MFSAVPTVFIWLMNVPVAVDSADALPALGRARRVCVR